MYIHLCCAYKVTSINMLTIYETQLCSPACVLVFSALLHHLINELLKETFSPLDFAILFFFMFVISTSSASLF